MPATDHGVDGCKGWAWLWLTPAHLCSSKQVVFLIVPLPLSCFLPTEKESKANEQNQSSCLVYCACDIYFQCIYVLVHTHCNSPHIPIHNVYVLFIFQEMKTKKMEREREVFKLIHQFFASYSKSKHASNEWGCPFVLP